MKNQQQTLNGFDVPKLRQNIQLGIAKARFNALSKSDQKKRLASSMAVVQNLLNSEAGPAMKPRAYQCRHCGKIVMRESAKAWIKSWCDLYQRNVRLTPVKKAQP